MFHKWYIRTILQKKRYQSHYISASNGLSERDVQTMREGIYRIAEETLETKERMYRSWHFKNRSFSINDTVYVKVYKKITLTLSNYKIPTGSVSYTVNVILDQTWWLMNNTLAVMSIKFDNHNVLYPFRIWRKLQNIK